MMEQRDMGTTVWNGHNGPKELPKLKPGIIASLYELEGGWIEVRIMMPSGVARFREPFEKFPSDELLLKVMLVAG